MPKSKGKIVINPGINVWPHELKTAEALLDAGKTVEFVKKSEVDFQSSADVLMDGVIWEMKSPKGDGIKAVERNVKRARNQSPNVIIDSKRLKNARDNQVEAYLRKCPSEIKGIRRIIFVNKKREIIDIL